MERHGIENLIPLTQRDPEEARAIRSKGGHAAAEKNRRRKTFKEDFLVALSSGDTQAAIIRAATDKAAGGDVAMLKLIAEIIGENGVQKTADVSEAVERENADRAAILKMLEDVG